MLIFVFLEKDLEIVSPPHFAYDFFSEKYCPCYILSIGDIPLPDCIYFLRC